MQLPEELTFEEWVTYVFDHPGEGPEWWWRTDDDAPWWNEEARQDLALAHMTWLFEAPAFLLDRFTPVQIDRGLNFLVSNGCSSHMFALTDTKLPWPDRRRCFDAMIPLYRDLMAPVYGDELGHLIRRIETGRPFFSCYMWWDVIPLYGDMGHPDQDRINEAVLHIFEETLKLTSEACLESALHGAGHWHMYLPRETEKLVRRFLTRRDITPELRRYAELAGQGAVQ